MGRRFLPVVDHMIWKRTVPFSKIKCQKFGESMCDGTGSMKDEGKNSFFSLISPHMKSPDF